MNHLFPALFIISIALFTIAAHAQDKIYKRDGTEIDAKVKSVGEKTVTYIRFDNPDGPEYTILESDIARIVYQNGKTDTFESFDKEMAHKRPGRRQDAGNRGMKYGKNIFSITPAAYTAAINGDINDVGVGISYERLLDQQGRISFYLPVLVNFSSTSDYSNYAVTTNQTYNSFYFMPGIKFYPARDRVKVRYSMGGSFFCIIGSEPMAVYENGYGYGGYTPVTPSPFSQGTFRYTMYGLMFTNSVNITATKHLFMALDLSMGVPVSDNRYAYNTDFASGGSDPFIQIGFKVGYRY